MNHVDEPATFHVSTETAPSRTVIAGFSQFGLAGLTAADYLVNHLSLEQTGHIRADGLPTITPFENGRPRYPTRLFSRPDLDVTVLVGELFVPVALAEPFSRAILGWTETAGVEEVAVLSGVPFAHGPEEHRAFFVASDDYRAAHAEELATTAVPDATAASTNGESLDEESTEPTDESTAETGAEATDDATAQAAPPIPPMANGFLDGTNAALMARAMESALAVAVYVTPVHAQAPDVEAAVRLVEAVDRVYDLGVDTGPLESFAHEVGEYYRNLAERLEEHGEEEQPPDRMYM
ncbi:proteasome assembly chaperone family protein [Halobaculum marinum]|uniref:Proteasome assembly chaperone family protein n=1 Tax=Halobaculum marinum TaxID=3031996 RepID=A0ABD5X288_9EURY|nr:PAC2 family protein [Halobaculum sp. DT55]